MRMHRGQEEGAEPGGYPGPRFTPVGVDIESLPYLLRGPLIRGANAWNEFKWNARVDVDLRNADLRSFDLEGYDLACAHLDGANLREGHLWGADLRGATLTNARLTYADLGGANLSKADLSSADLRNANLEQAILVETVLSGANLAGCKVYGISAWNIKLNDLTVQTDLRIMPYGNGGLTVDNVEMAQFIHLLLKNDKLRDIIDTITSKTVLILGRFTEERKNLLDQIRNELRHSGFVPVLFDFDKPETKDLTGTVETLARMARFIIADLTDPSSVPHELAAVVPFLRTTPVLPIRQVGSRGYAMFDDFQRAYPWVLPTHEYANSLDVILELPRIIAPANELANTFRNPR